MSSRPFKVSPANLSGQNKLFREDKALPSGTPYGNKISDRPMALRSAVCISGPPETKPSSYISPKLNGRSAIYKMSRSPYFKPHLMVGIDATLFIFLICVTEKYCVPFHRILFAVALG